MYILTVINEVWEPKGLHLVCWQTNNVKVSLLPKYVFVGKIILYTIAVFL